MILEPRGRSIKRAGIPGTEDAQASVEYACVTQRKAGGRGRDGPHSRLTSEQGSVRRTGKRVPMVPCLPQDHDMSRVRSQTHSIGADHPGEEAVEEEAYPLLRGGLRGVLFFSTSFLRRTPYSESKIHDRYSCPDDEVFAL